MAALPFRDAGVVLTRKDYEMLPEDGQDYEIVFGVLTMAPRPLLGHQRVPRRLDWAIAPHLAATGRSGELVYDADLILDDLNTYVSPDLMYFSADQAARLDPDRRITTIPTLVVEVLSPSTAERDRVHKRQAYARAGVPHYWIFDTRRRRVHELTLQPTGEYAERVVRAPATFRPALFPDLAIDLTEVFAR